MKVILPISVHDIELFKDVISSGAPLLWAFDTDTGESIDIVFTPETEDVVG